MGGGVMGSDLSEEHREVAADRRQPGREGRTDLRHAPAMNVYSHVFPDKDESARGAIAAAFASRADSLRTEPGQTSV